MDLKDLANNERPLTGRTGVIRIKWVVIESRFLDGEHVLLVLDKKHLKEARCEHPGMVIYFPPEISELGRHQDIPEYVDLLRKVHMVKKEIGGWIVPSNLPVHHDSPVHHVRHVHTPLQETPPPPIHIRGIKETRQVLQSNTSQIKKEPARAEQMRISYGRGTQPQP